MYLVSEVNVKERVGDDFKRARDRIATVERLKSKERSLVFLNKCRNLQIIPTCIKSSLKAPSSIATSRACCRALHSTGLRLLNILIREHHNGIKYLKTACHQLDSIIPDDIQTCLNPIYEQAAECMKMERKANYKKKLSKLTTKNKMTSPQSATPDANNSNIKQERITVLDNISISEDALSALAKGPKFAITPTLKNASLQKMFKLKLPP